MKTYVSRLLAKLDLANRTQAAILAYEAGLPDTRREPGQDPPVGTSPDAKAATSSVRERKPRLYASDVT